MRRLLFLLLCLIPLIGSEIYFLPYDSKAALKKLYKIIDSSTDSIDIAIYTFTDKKIAKRLKNAAKRGVKIRIIYDRDWNLKSGKSRIGYLEKYKNISSYTLSGKPYKKSKRRGKMHAKFMIVDSKTVLCGSANLSYSAFHTNYEVLQIDRDYQKAALFKRYFERMLKESKPY